MELTFLEQDHRTCTDPLSSLQVFPYVSLRHSIYHCEGEKHILSHLYEMEHNQKLKTKSRQEKKETEIPSYPEPSGFTVCLERTNAKPTNHADG